MSHHAGSLHAGSHHAGSLLPAQRAALIAEVGQVAREVLAPLAHAGVPGRVNRPLVRALGEQGLLGRLFPTGLGGSSDGPPRARVLCALREALAGVSPAAETTFAVQGLGSYPILEAGRPEQAERWIPAVARGEAVAAFALTEPDAGSDAAALSLSAEPDGQGWRLTGVKQWISHAPDAEVYTVFARTTAGAGARGVTAFVVSGDAPGLSGEPIELIAPHAVGRLEFDGVPLGPGDVLGEVDGGFRVAMRTLDRFRPSVGAAAVGMAQAALDAAVGRAAKREMFGGRLKDQQAIAHRLADVAAEVQAARLLVYEAAAAHDASEASSSTSASSGGESVREAAAVAKLFATEAAQRAVDTSVQVHGALGLQAGQLVAELYREVRSLRIYEGASEVQRTIVARGLFRNVELEDSRG